MTPAYEQLRAQLDDAEQNMIAHGIIVDAVAETLSRAQEDLKRSQNVYVALHRQMIEWHKENEVSA
jgi:hypothetical protein